MPPPTPFSSTLPSPLKSTSIYPLSELSSQLRFFHSNLYSTDAPHPLWSLLIFLYSLSQSHTQLPTHLRKAETGISSLMSSSLPLSLHILPQVPSVLNPLISLYSIPFSQSLLPQLQSRPSWSLTWVVTTVTSSSDFRMIFTECHCVHGTSYVKPLTGSSLHTEEIWDPAWHFLISLLSWRHFVTQVLKYSQLPKYTKLFCPIPTHCPLCLAHFHQLSDLLLTVSHFAGRFFTVWATKEAH